MSDRTDGTASAAVEGEFAPGAQVRSLRAVKNDGVYPHKAIGEFMVRQGDIGVVRQRWSFLGEIYYTVEFAGRSAVVILRGREMAS
ncbi:MAG TPA: nitrogen fixation protein NifZ [Paraburkholderia sp.]|nr:nitrogen fixation protein NifZ [Paraburkholderia sp.]